MDNCNIIISPTWSCKIGSETAELIEPDPIMEALRALSKIGEPQDNSSSWVCTFSAYSTPTICNTSVNWA